MGGKSLHRLSAPGIEERTIRGDDNTNLASQPRTEPERRYVIRIDVRLCFAYRIVSLSIISLVPRLLSEA
jgi:hypothetical protein